MGSPVSYLALACETAPAPPACVREAGAAPVKPCLLDRVCFALRLRHYSRRAEDAYVGWTAATSSATASGTPPRWASCSRPS